jgi:hypothetical protein
MVQEGETIVMALALRLVSRIVITVSQSEVFTRRQVPLPVTLRF